MAIPVQTLTNEEIEVLIEGFDITNVGARLLLDKLTVNLESYNLNVRKGFAFNVEGTEVKFVTVSNEEETLKITYALSNGEEDVFGSVIVQKGDVKILKAYELVDGEVVETLNMEVTDEYLEDLKNVKDPENMEIADNKEDVLAQLPCIYGNWCGPGCGSGTPISKVDSCCKAHDGCYGSTGYFACSCDRKLHRCLAPYVADGSQWAITISLWFKKQPCNPLK